VTGGTPASGARGGPILPPGSPTVRAPAGARLFGGGAAGRVHTRFAVGSAPRGVPAGHHSRAGVMREAGHMEATL